MKKLLLLLFAALLISTSLFAQISGGSQAWISSRSADLKTSTWFFASTLGSLELAAEVSVLQVSGNWAEVRSVTNPSLQGWTSLGNLSSRQITASGAGASATEVALAGRGFSRDTESAFRAQGTPLNFADVDRAEAITVSPGDLLNFIREGRLNAGE